MGATLPLLGSAALAAVPGGRYATASALVSSARQLGGVLGISILVLIVGNPTGPGVVAALRDGWMLSIVAFVLVAVVALPIGKVAARSDDEDVEHGSPLLLLPQAEFLASRADPGPASSIGLGDIPLVAALSADARAALAAASGRLDLDAGEWLVREGDPPGSAYLLRSGRLEVVQGDRCCGLWPRGRWWASWPCSPASRGRPVSRPPGRHPAGDAARRPSTRCSTGTRGRPDGADPGGRASCAPPGRGPTPRRPARPHVGRRRRPARGQRQPRTSPT